MVWKLKLANGGSAIVDAEKIIGIECTSTGDVGNGFVHLTSGAKFEIAPGQFETLLTIMRAYSTSNPFAAPPAPVVPLPPAPNVVAQK